MAGRHVACSLQVALAKREKKRREKAFCEHAHGRGRAGEGRSKPRREAAGTFPAARVSFGGHPGHPTLLSSKCKVTRLTGEAMYKAALKANCLWPGNEVRILPHLQKGAEKHCNSHRRAADVGPEFKPKT